MARILTIDDEKPIRISFRSFLEDYGHEVFEAENGRMGLRVFEEKKPELVLVDLRMPEMDGLEVLSHITRFSPNTPVIVVSGTGMISDAIEALRLGAWDYLLKPIGDLSVLLHAVDKVLERAHLIYENKEYQNRLQVLVAEKTDELKKASEELTDVYERLRLTLEATNDGMWDWNPHTNEAYLSDRWYTMLGYEPNAFPQNFTTWSMLIHPDDHDRVMACIEKTISERSDIDYECRARRSDETWAWIHSRGKCFSYDSEGKPLRLVGTHTDITVRKHVEEELYRRSQAIEQSQDGIFITDINGMVEFSNSAFATILGRNLETIEKHHLSQLHTPKLMYDKIIPTLQKIMEEGKFVGEFDVPRVDGTTVPLRMSVSLLKDNTGNHIGMVGIAHDLTLENSMEDQLRQTQKLEAIGTLAGGIAHDFNNILSPILGFTEIVRRELPKGSEAKENLGSVMEAARRATDLVRQILTFSRQSKTATQPVLVGVIAKEALKLLRASIPSTIEFEVHLDPDAGMVKADPTQVHQVLINLCTNAYHAMRGFSGTLKVSVQAVVPDKNLLLSFPNLEMGIRYVQLTVSDSGCGMDIKTSERIFEPFFTTKEKGEGTGLGLSTVHGIVHSMGGDIAVNSRPGQGTTFTVHIPQFNPQKQQVVDIEKDVPLGQNEHILIVDDEEAIVLLAKTMIERLKYRVTTMTDSIAALELFRASPDAFDLLVTDMTMPGITGKQLAREVLSIRPGFPIVIATGYSEMADPEILKRIGVDSLIMKPFSLLHIATAIRNGLDKTDGTPSTDQSS